MSKTLQVILTMLFIGHCSFAQTITGTITSDDGIVPGVNILEKGTTNGTISDGNGRYALEASPNGILIFSFIGYESQEIPIGGRSTIDIKMAPATTALEEVIVIAYGTAKKSDFTGAASVVGQEGIQKVVSTNIAGSLQGTVSGVQVNNASSEPGGAPEIRIRGISSINGNSSPLFVVNGAPFGGDLNSINPNDIESITVLKDASATALYGSRASAGVVLINTKKGVPGRPSVTFRTTQGVTGLALPLHTRPNNAQYYEMRWEAGKNGFLDGNPGATLADAEAFATSTLLSKLGGYNSYDRFPLLPNGKIDPAANPRWGTGPNDWEDAIMKPGPRRDYYFGVNGGTDRGLNYNLSVGYLEDAGGWDIAEFNRITTRLDVTQKINDIVEIGLGTGYSNALKSTPNFALAFRFIQDMPDIYPIYQWDDANNTFLQGNDNGRVFDMGGGNQFSYNGLSRATWANNHPLQQKAEDIFDTKQNNLNTRAFISITPIKGLNFRSSISADYVNNNLKFYRTSLRGFGFGTGGTLTRQSDRNLVYTFSNLLSYAKSFGKHNFNILGGIEAYSLENQRLISNGRGFPTPTLSELGAASLITGGSSSVDQHNIESYLSKVDYNYEGKYFLSGSFRRDGTSRFFKDSRWGNFGSIGASWRVGQEDFMDDFSGWMNDLTVRASIGSQGNENISSFFAFQGTYGISQDRGTTALLQNTITNNSLRWENNIQTNVGLTIGLFGRVDVNLDYFVKNSQDLLFSRELPFSSGLASIAENVGDVQNKGFEIELHTNNLPSGNLKWETSINIAHYKNTITRLPSDEIQAGLYRYKVGVSTFEYFTREWRGVNPANGRAQWSTATGEVTENLNEAALDFRGSALPTMFGNVMNTFIYKGVDLSVNLVYSFGGKIYDTQYQRMSHAGARNIAETFNADSYDYWTPENTDATMTRMSDHGPTSNSYHQNSTRYLFDRTHARVRNITLGYTLPITLASKIGAKSLRVFVQADNYITFFKEKGRGLDPEQQISGGGNITFIPPMKTFQGGVEFSF